MPYKNYLKPKTSFIVSSNEFSNRKILFLPHAVTVEPQFR